MSDFQSDSVADFLFAEAAAIDEQRWDDWLDFFSPNAEYWIPAWNGEHELVDDPSSQISLIY